MRIISKITDNTTNFVNTYCDLSKEELEKVKYGIEIFVLNIYKIIVVLIIAHLLGILLHTLLLMFSYNLIRLYAFGIHAKTGLSCLIWTSIIFLGFSYISPYVQLHIFYISILFAFNIISAMLFAPADTEKRPLINFYKRRLLKIKTVASLLFLYLLVIFYCNSTCANLLTFGSLVACIVINPLVYKISGQRYNNYKYYQKKEA